jgi:hypothetical protein
VTRGSATSGIEAARRRLEDELAAALHSPVRVAFSRSRRHAIQLRRTRHGRGATATSAYDVRLAPFFATADPQVRADLAEWLRNGRRARATHERLMAWIDARFAELPPRVLPAWARRTDGEHHDLAALAAALDGARGAEALARLERRPTIGFGRFPTRGPRRSLDLGNYDRERDWVRIHPVLDAADVPAWFVRFVLYHELLHALAAQEKWDDGAPHGPTFRAHEALLPDTARAKSWQRAHTDELLARTRRAVRAKRSSGTARATGTARTDRRADVSVD